MEVNRKIIKLDVKVWDLDDFFSYYANISLVGREWDWRLRTLIECAREWFKRSEWRKWKSAIFYDEFAKKSSTKIHS